MKVGSKVVCVDDVFPSLIRELYEQLPVKGKTYTVREVTLGREKVAVFKDGKPVENGASEESVTVRILLVELVNPPDPFHRDLHELGFNAERFREVEENEAEEAMEMKASVGAFANN